jgi:DNA-binding response OmpR family regulator
MKEPVARSMIVERPPKILLVEDDKDISHLVKLHLEDEGFSVDVAADGSKGLTKAQGQAYDLIVLDLMLPGMDGLEICRRLRGETDYVPILMLTAKASEIDRIVGLELGADDYLTKPFSVRELVARVKAIFRRVSAVRAQTDAQDSPFITLGALVIETETLSLPRNTIYFIISLHTPEGSTPGLSSWTRSGGTVTRAMNTPSTHT